MTQLYDDQDLIGKTIKSVGYTDNIYALFFTDDSFVVFRGCGWNEHDVEISGEELSLTPNYRNKSTLRDLGLITKEEFQSLFDKEQKENNQRMIEEEKIKLIELKIKYPEL